MKRKIWLGVGAVVFVYQFAIAQEHVGNVLGGEAKLEILHRYDGPGILPRPTQVVIQDFTNKGPIVEDVKRPSLAGGRTSHLHYESNPSATPDELVRQIQDSFAKTLLGQLKKMNVEPARASDVSAIVGPALVVQGEFTTIAPGNSRKRIIVGFGRGASDLRTHVTIAEIVNGHKTILLECNIDSQSGKKPGAILSPSPTAFAAGMVIGHFGDKRSSTVQADASRMAKLIGKETRSIIDLSQWIAKPSAS